MTYPIPKPRPMLPRLPIPQPQTPILFGRVNQFRTNNRAALLQAGIGLIAGRTPQEQMAMAAQGFGSARMASRTKQEQEVKRNQTLEFLRKRNPELAAAVQAGLPIQDAFNHHLRAQTSNDGLDAYGFPRSGAISQKMRAYKMQGIDDEKALGLATGRYSVSINPQTGERVIVDVASGQIIPLIQPETQAQVAQAPIQSPPTDSQQGLYDQAKEATGFASTLGNLSSNIVGQIPGAVGDMATFPGSVKAVQEFELFKRDLIRSMSLNPKFPVTEQQRIENLVPRGAFTSPDTLQQALRSLDANLARIEAEIMARLNDPATPVQQRQQDTVTLHGVQAARLRMAVPQYEAGEGTLQPPQGGSDLKTKYGLE